MTKVRISLIAGGVAAVATAALAAAVTAPATAGDPPRSAAPTAATAAVNGAYVPEGLEMDAAVAQERMEPIVERVYEIGKKHPGLAITAIDVDTLTVTVRWKGLVPAALTKLASTRRHGVTVEILPADYSQTEIDAATEAALNALGTDRSYGGGGTLDRSGLLIDVPPALASGPEADALQTDVRRALEHEAPGLAGMPVGLREGAPIAGLPYLDPPADRERLRTRIERGVSRGG